MTRPHVRERKPGVWQVMFDIGPDPVTGKRRQRSRQFGTEADALAYRDQLEAELEAGLFIDDGSMTVNDLMGAWLTAKASQVTPSTLATYRHQLKHLEPIGRRKISAISGGTLTLLYSRMLEAGHSPAVVYATHRVARAMFRSAVRWGYLREDPTFRAEPPRYRPREMTTWSAEDLGRFLAETQGRPLHPAFVILAMTGMRRGEVCGLRWSDVDLSAGTLTVARSVAVVDGARVEGEPKTRGSRRTIALDAATVEYLRALRASRPTALQKHDGRLPEGKRPSSPEPQPGGLQWSHVITTANGDPYHPQTVSRTFDRYVAKLGLPPIRLHDLRHTFATLALEAGVHVRVVADRLGHASPAITLSIYSHSTTKLDREAAEAVSRLVGER